MAHLIADGRGFGVDYFTYDGDRPTLRKWAEREKNARSIDGLPTATS